MKLASSVIVRNERGRYLEPALGHLLEFCDEVCVLDDGSTDGWEEPYNPGMSLKVLRGSTRADWSVPFNNHAAARQQLLEFTLAREPTYILAIDADELVSDGPALRRACEQGRAPTYSLRMEEVWEACDDRLCIREDGGWASHPVTMVWSPAHGVGYKIRDLGHATGRTPHGISGGEVVGECLHFGWSNRAERAERYERYAVGDGGKYHARTHIDSIMVPESVIVCRARPWPEALESWREELLVRSGKVLA